MGFLDKAKAAANDLAAKADTALASSGLGGPGATASPDRLLRDLGVLAYLEASGRVAPEGERERVMAALHQLESSNALQLTLQTTAPSDVVPPPPGSTMQPPAPGASTPPRGAAPAAPPPPPGASSPPPPPPPPSAPPSGTTPPASAPPPPPPSWLQKDAGDA